MNLRASVAIMAIAFALVGCSMGRDLRQIRFCLSPGRDATMLKSTFQDIASKENLQYYDWSAETQQQLENLDDSRFEVRRSFPLINIAVRGRDGLGVGGGNAGLPANQVAFGFTEGNDKRESQRFAQRVIGRLGRIWEIRQGPAVEDLPC